MQEYTITKGATSQIITISIYDSSSTTGAKLAGLVFNTASLSAYYNRSGAAGAATVITLVTATKGTWVSSGFVAVDGTNMPGDYELSIPDAVCASGADTVMLQLKGAANMVPVNIKLHLTAVDLQDAVRGGMTALPNANADAALGLPISDAGGLDLDAILDVAISSRMATFTQPTGFLAATFPTTVASTTNITAGTITTATNLTTNNDKTGYAVLSTGLDLVLENSTFNIANSARIWNELLTGGTFNIPTSSGRRLRGLADTFIVHEGTADAGTVNTITFEVGASTVNDIYQGDRVIITGGTGIGEHGIITGYVGSTRVAAMSQNWVVTPNDTSVYEVTPADVDVETWQHLVVQNSATSLKPCVDIFSVSDDTTAADNLELDYDGTGYNKANSTIGTTTTNTDMVGTDNAALASVCTETRLAELDAANLPADVDGIKAVTVQFAFTVAGQVDSNTLYVNNQVISGDGGVGTEFQGA